MVPVLLNKLPLLICIADGLLSWANYPGFELWRFVNLLIFVICGFYLHRRLGGPIREALRSRGEGIKRELMRAQEEKDRALAKLSEVEARFAGLDSEVATIEAKARREAAAEQERISIATEQEITKIREQAKREIESAGKAARLELRRFAATESVRLAEDILRVEIGPADDRRLTTQNVENLRGSRV